MSLERDVNETQRVPESGDLMRVTAEDMAFAKRMGEAYLAKKDAAVLEIIREMGAENCVGPAPAELTVAREGEWMFVIEIRVNFESWAYLRKAVTESTEQLSANVFYVIGGENNMRIVLVESEQDTWEAHEAHPRILMAEPE